MHQKISSAIFLYLMISQIASGQVLIKGSNGSMALVYDDGRIERVQMLSMGSENYAKPPEHISELDIWMNFQAAEHAVMAENEIGLQIVRISLRISELENQINKEKTHLEQLRQLNNLLEMLTNEKKKANEWALFLGRQIFNEREHWLSKIESWSLEFSKGKQAEQNSTALAKVPERTVRPQPPCYTDKEVQRTSINEISSMPQLFLFYTDSSMARKLDGEDLLKCYGHLVKSGGGLYKLILEMKFHNQVNPVVFFGTMPLGAILELKLLNGRTVRLFNRLENSAVWQQSEKEYSMKASYNIGASEMTQLRQSEVTWATIGWSKTVMDFEIYYLDFFINQFRCLLSVP